MSGASAPEKRPGFAEVLQLAETGKFRILLIWKIDRLARSLVHAVTTVNSLVEKHHVVLCSVTEPIDTASAMGQTIFAILAGMAQQERQAIRERTLAGRKAKARKGGFAGAMAPYGYRKEGEGGLVIFEPEALIVRRIFRERQGGATLQQIADFLNAEGISTRHKGKWHPATIAYVLDNVKYRGQVEYLFRWQDEKVRVIQKGEHEPIVDAQETLQNGGFPARVAES